MADTAPLGRFCWYELMTPDPAAAEEFYPAVTGWGTEVWEGGGMPYTMWMNGEAAVGGVAELPEEAREAGAPPHWLAYVSTPDCDATLEAVGRLGGRTVWGPVDVPHVGRVAGFTDPHGAVLALHQPAGGSPPEADRSRPGWFSWHELASDDWRASRDFYGELFGWKDAGEQEMGPELGIYRMFADDPAAPEGVATGGMFDRGDSIPMAAWILYVSVPELDAALEEVDARGGEVVHGPMEVPGGDRVAQCVDPQGAVFALHAAG
jgi:hypothetical protein